jgi:hypothetical protein
VPNRIQIAPTQELHVSDECTTVSFSPLLHERSNEPQQDSGAQSADPAAPRAQNASQTPKRHASRADLGPRIRRLTRKRADLTALRAETAALVTPEVAAQLADRPRTRGDCADGPRPCPWAACRHHLALDVNPETGSMRVVPDPAETCSLDVADRGGVTLEEIGQLTNLTRERIRQIEHRGLRLLKLRMPRW